MRLLTILLTSAAAIRFALAIRGGQYFDWDEHRYGFATLMLERLRLGDGGGALDIMFRYPDHPGFKIAGLVPAALQQMLHPAQTISDMRQPSGEWLAAFVFSLSSVAAIAATYALGRRAGGSERESMFAAFLMFASTTMLMHARHFLPYDLALLLGLIGLWVALSPSDRSIDSIGAGILAGAAFSTYYGDWLLGGVVLGAHVLWRPASFGRRLRRATLSGLGFMALPTVLVVVSGLRNRPLVSAARGFAARVTHGEFAEGWSLPWAFFWHAEGALLLIAVAGIALVVGQLPTLKGSAYMSTLKRSLDTSTPAGRGVRWAAATASIYAGLVIGSNVLHRFVVYDRLAKPMWPFMCLAAAAGIAGIDNGRWLAGRRALWLYAIVFGLFVMNSAPLLTQRYPREIVHEVLDRYGAAAVAFDTSLEHIADSSSGFFFPAAPPAPSKRFVLLNARDIWFEGEPGVRPPPEGRVIATWRHPRQLPFMQYHGYTPAQRAFMRTTDASIQLVDRGGGSTPDNQHH